MGSIGCVEIISKAGIMCCLAGKDRQLIGQLLAICDRIRIRGIENCFLFLPTSMAQDNAKIKASVINLSVENSNREKFSMQL